MESIMRLPISAVIQLNTGLDPLFQQLGEPSEEG